MLSRSNLLRLLILVHCSTFQIFSKACKPPSFKTDGLSREPRSLRDQIQHSIGSGGNNLGKAPDRLFKVWRPINTTGKNLLDLGSHGFYHSNNLDISHYPCLNKAVVLHLTFAYSRIVLHGAQENERTYELKMHYRTSLSSLIDITRSQLKFTVNSNANGSSFHQYAETCQNHTCISLHDHSVALDYAKNVSSQATYTANVTEFVRKVASSVSKGVLPGNLKDPFISMTFSIGLPSRTDSNLESEISVSKPTLRVDYTYDWDIYTDEFFESLMAM